MANYGELFSETILFFYYRYRPISSDIVWYRISYAIWRYFPFFFCWLVFRFPFLFYMDNIHVVLSFSGFPFFLFKLFCCIPFLFLKADRIEPVRCCLTLFHDVWRYLDAIWRYPTLSDGILTISWRYLDAIWRYLDGIWRYWTISWRYLCWLFWK